MKNLFQDLKLGFSSYWEALKFIKKHQMWVYFLFPVLLFLGIYYLGFIFQNLRAETVVEDDASIFIRGWQMFVRGFFALLATIMFSFMRYVLIILLSPVLSVVSERVERILTSNKYKFNLKQLIKDIKRTMNLAIRNLVWELSIVGIFIACFWLLSKILALSDNVHDFIVGGFTMFVAFYYYGFGFIDYLSERRRLNIDESVTFVRKHRGLALALGSLFTVVFVYTNNYFNEIRESLAGGWMLTLVIIASILLAFIPIITMVAATLSVHKLVDLNTNPFAEKDPIQPKKLRRSKALKNSKKIISTEEE